MSEVEQQVPPADRTEESESVPEKPPRASGKRRLMLMGSGAVAVVLMIAGGTLYIPKKISLSKKRKTATTVSPKTPAPAAGAMQAKITTAATQPEKLLPGAENFVYHVEGVADSYEYQLDAREKWRALTDTKRAELQVSGRDEITFLASDVLCALSAPCTGPEGQGTLAGLSEVDPLDFPAPEAHFQALIARIGESTFEVGRLKTYTVPKGSGTQTVKVMANVREPELGASKFGYRVKVRILRHNR